MARPPQTADMPAGGADDLGSPAIKVLRMVGFDLIGRQSVVLGRLGPGDVGVAAHQGGLQLVDGSLKFGRRGPLRDTRAFSLGS